MRDEGGGREACFIRCTSERLAVSECERRDEAFALELLLYDLTSSANASSFSLRCRFARQRPMP